jgi:hypothetical protein
MCRVGSEVWPLSFVFTHEISVAGFRTRAAHGELGEGSGLLHSR